MNAEITRFAPSPTGHLHIGGARTALFSYLLARSTGGKFLLRIEDTDKSRNVEAAVTALIRGLDWLGIRHDNRIVYQSECVDRHKQIVKQLVKEDKAYYCNCSKEVLDSKRKNTTDKPVKFKYDRSCRNLGHTEGVVRLKVPIDKTICWKDAIKGMIKINTSELDDFIISRSDGSPVYNLAVTVDDHDMGITTVLRGDDHVYNTPKQILLYEALGWDKPKFGHLPMIYGSDKKKMSKRHGATSVIEYKDLGYLPEALRNFLARLGWSYKDKELFSDKELIELFSLKGVNKSPSIFDLAKLNWVNKQHLKEMDAKDILIHSGADVPHDNKVMILDVIDSVKDKIDNINVINEVISRILSKPTGKYSADIKSIIRNKFTYISESRWNKKLIQENISEIVRTQKLNPRDLYTCLNRSVYGADKTPNTLGILEAMGKERVMERLR